MNRILLPVGVLLLAAALVFTSAGATEEFTPTTPSEQKFYELSTGGNSFCTGPENTALMGERLQGSCCSEMSLHRYEEQVEGLKAYAHIPEIPPNPYDIPQEWAEEMINYDSETALTQEQREVYDEASELSNEGGPCCCRCWRWYAYSGLGKLLITEYDYSAEEVANVWDLSDGCGGEHAH